MNYKKIVFVLVAIFLMCQSRNAWCLYIFAESFESPALTLASPGPFGGYSMSAPPGWTVSPTSVDGGVWNLNDFHSAGNYPVSTLAPDGKQIGWTSGTLTKVLTNNLQVGYTYTLTGMVGRQTGDTSGYKVDLLAGSTLLATFSGTPTSGTFIPFTLTYKANASSPSGALTIVLSRIVTDFSSVEVEFDNIKLDAAPPAPTPVGGIGITLITTLAVAGYGIWRSRK